MNIQFDEENKIFHLYNQHISYIMKIMKNNQLGHLYYGKRLYGDDFEHLYYQKDIPTVCVYEKEQSFTMATMRQEYATYGATDYSSGAYKIVQEDGSIITNFEFLKYEIIKEKPEYNGLPMSFGKSLTLKISLLDKVISTTLEMHYTIFDDVPIISRHNKIINNGSSDIRLDYMMSGQLDFDTKDFTMLQLDGAWARERYVNTRKIEYGITQIESLLGASGHIQNPAFLLMQDGVAENHGQVFGFNFVYSGSFIGKVEVGSHNRTRVTMGIHPDNFEYNLEPTEEFITPEMLISYSDIGINKLSQSLHKFIRNNIMNPITKNKRTPFLTNNWEATYFDFDEQKILDIAKKSYEAGVELFVLDDGWFGKRNADDSSLGDWYTDKTKLPDGVEGLSKKITAMGMKFGLWFEPEMISKRSELYKKHPEYAIKTPNRHMSYGRQQFVLDFTNDEVIDCVYGQMCKIIDNSTIDYIKWDMNRNITEPFSKTLKSKNQGKFMHKYILGVYKLYEMLTKRYPTIIFESCAGGGGRFDLAMLYYAPQTWASDNTDPYERLKIQYGTSIFYPLKSIGAHVSAIKSHQTARKTSLDFKASVAYFGNFGYELDVDLLNEIEIKSMEKQMEFYDKNWQIIHEGEFYRLESPFEGNTNHISWMVKKDENIILGIYNILYVANQPIRRVKLQGLEEQGIYEDELGQKYSGSELMNFGYMIENNICAMDHFESNLCGNAEFSSNIISFKQIR